MNDVLTYLKFRGDISLKEKPFNEVDAMVLSLVASIDYDGFEVHDTSLSELYTYYIQNEKKKDNEDRRQEKREVLFLVSESKRYEDFIVERYIRDIDDTDEKTFYAMTFKRGFSERYTAFRGTDGSLISWKENFNTLCEMPTPGQKDAAQYLSEELSHPFCKCTVIGHSKGGNLAAYSAISADRKLQKKIKAVYVFDGPGFTEDISEHEGYLAVKDRMKVYVPVSCVIGNLMKPPYERTVVKAEGSGVYQHDLFNWAVGPTSFIKVAHTDSFSESLSKKVNDWIESLPEGGRERVVNELFDMFKKNGILHLSDLMHFDLKKILGLIMSATMLSSENRTLLVIIIKEIRSHH